MIGKRVSSSMKITDMRKDNEVKPAPEVEPTGFSPHPDETDNALVVAGKALYFAGKWECPEIAPEVQSKLWDALRDALGIPVGGATEVGVGQ